MTAVKKHCAIYTRKSTDDRLDMEFNSLDAQRESCLAYITSQRSEGWSALQTHYDDGGFSGGSMDRPALARLLDDIAAGKVHIVVVYKIDRLTRSLMDFARLVQIFDQHGVTFVSVTQSFNTTTSMGRLTLNVLLSFAQFEREVAGERIRDKIAASKRKGMWMGGNLPLGYDVKDRHLIVNQAEAETVRHIFERYMELGNVRLLKAELERDGITGKRRSVTDDQVWAGKPIGRGALYTILSNPVYIGRIRHRTESYEGQHEAIVPPELWKSVQARLAAQTMIEPSSTRSHDTNLLRGLPFDEAGAPYTPSFAVKSGKRYRYYVCSTRKAKQRLPAHALEAAVETGLRAQLQDQYSAAALFGLDLEHDHDWILTMITSAPAVNIGDLIPAIARIVIRQNELTIEVGLPALARTLTGECQSDVSGMSASGIIIVPFITEWAARSIVIKPPSARRDLLDMPPDRLKKLVQGIVWRDRHFAGETMRQIGDRDGISDSYVSKQIFQTFV